MTGHARSVDCPYVGLLPFDPAHADYFFGRTLDSEILADNALARTTTVLYGTSGVGKSSVLNVGLPRALKEFGVGPRIACLNDWHEPNAVTRWLDKAVAEARAARSPSIVVLDQVEEYFLYANADQVSSLAESLGELVGRGDLNAHLLIAVREDSLHRLDAMRVHVPSLLDTTLELRHLDESAVREAIEQPIAVWNESTGLEVALDEDFSRTLIEQLRSKVEPSSPGQGGRIELAYLQLVLEKVWEAEGGANARALRTATLVERLKGVTEIARGHVEDVLESLPHADRAVCSLLFDRLVTHSGAKLGYATRDLAPVAHMATERVDGVLAPLTSGHTRILRSVNVPAVDLPGGRAPGYEILHDILARPIRDWSVRTQAKRQAESEKRNARLAAVGLGLMCVIAASYALMYRQVARTEAELKHLAVQGVGSADPSTVVNAMGEASRNQELPLSQVLGAIPDSAAARNSWFALVALELDEAVRDSASYQWASEARRLLPFRVSEARRIRPPPSTNDDEALNARIEIPGGTFIMGSGGGLCEPEIEPHPVMLSAFKIQSHEVTNAEYWRFDASHDPNQEPEMPVVRVSWYDAMAYAAWLGGALPTEAQWEFTARGKEGRPYPWGSEGPDCGRAHVFDCAVEGRHQPRPVSPARESGKTPEAVYDLAGNVSEWCRDWFALSYPTVQAEVIDPAGPRAGSERVMRGASFNDPADLLCASSRGRWDPDDGAQDNLGFRVVWASP